MGSVEDSRAREPERQAADEFAAADERLRRLEQRLDRASEAAERLIAEAAAAAVREPPPAGWQQRERDADAAASERGAAGLEFELLLEAIQALRDRIPPELQRRLGEALREVLLAIRALIDWYLERRERRGGEPAPARDIPIV
jgi:hypothetical protein